MRATMDIVEGQTPRDRMRAADTDRERVAELLRSAHAEGRLELAEYDARIQQAWAARTYGELDPLTADLPAGREESSQRWPQPAAPASPHLGHKYRGQGNHGQGNHGYGNRGRGGTAAWLSVSVLNVVIWALVCVATREWIYPWWIWIAVPWGAVLLMRWGSERGRKSSQ
jgi:hypothetical protein